MSISNPEFSQSSIMRPVNVTGMGSHAHAPVPVLVLAAIGVVFGDIGTSPLYALKECFSPEHGIPFSEGAVMGIISMIVWSLILIVTVKYVVFVLRADNNGEGGVLSLMALAMRATRSDRHKITTGLLMLGALGACMLLGESVITPAISVLSAVEGLEVITPDLKRYVIPITLVIVILLFYVQSYGTAAVGRWFGPIMLVWFSALAVFGIINIWQNPMILKAVSPYYAAAFIHEHALQAYIVMGSVVLAVTGVEALYLDMGHFGRKPVRLAWLLVTLPALLANYFGQGALLLSNPQAAENPFFLMVPEFLLWPMVVLATDATVIASQAVISGAFSLANQGILLGFLPRMQILHTSETERGQIYMPMVNWVLLVLVIFYGDPVQRVWQPSSSIRHLCDHYDADHHQHAVGGDVQRMETQTRVRCAAGSNVFRVGFFVLDRQSDQSKRWRMVSAGTGCDLLRDADHLVQRPPAASRARSRRFDTTVGFCVGATRTPTASGRRHRRVPDRAHRFRACGVAAQPETQPRAARARDLPETVDLGCPLCA